MIWRIWIFIRIKFVYVSIIIKIDIFFIVFINIVLIFVVFIFGIICIMKIFKEVSVVIMFRIKIGIWVFIEI